MNNKQGRNKKIAIVYDWIDKWGGVERVLLTLHEMFPDAPMYTSSVDFISAAWATSVNVVSSFMQQLPPNIRNNRIASMAFYPFAFESFDFDGFDTVISVSSSYAKSVITKPGTEHINYMLTPPRYLYSHREQYVANGVKKIAATPYVRYLTRWDYVAGQRPDKILTISKTAQERCMNYYHRESEIVYPPFDLAYWKKIKSTVNRNQYGSGLTRTSTGAKITEYYLIVSRLEPYKKIDLAIQVFNRLHIPLVIVGKGSQGKKLRKMAGENVRFYEELSDDELGHLYSQAEALIMPQEEDFGYTSLEAQFFGCPVIAYAAGGATETVLDKKTGILFSEQSPPFLKRAIEDFHIMSYNLKKSTRILGMKNVERFNKETFFERFQSAITNPQINIKYTMF